MKNVLYDISFDNKGPLMLIPVSKCNQDTGKLNKNVVIKLRNITKVVAPRLVFISDFSMTMNSKQSTHYDRIFWAGKCYCIPQPSTLVFSKVSPVRLPEIKFHLSVKRIQIMPFGLQSISVRCMSQLIREMFLKAI